MMPVVLLHAGNPSEKLIQFLQSIGAHLIALPDYDGQTKLTHILTTGNQDFAALSQAYHTVEDDVRIVALTGVQEFSSFLAGNGRLVWDVNWEQGELGNIWLEKFFLGTASVHLDESFPTVKDGGHFNVMNVFKTGAELDRLAAFVHARGDAVVSVRTFMDHAFYYLTYLHQAGVALLPIEVDYGYTGSETVVQIHLPVNGFVAEHMLESFCDVDSRNAQKFVLGVCARSADFMEVQYIQSAAKLVISGFWRPEQAKRQRGLMLNHIQTTAQIKRNIERIIKEASVAEIANKPLDGRLPTVRIDESDETVMENETETARFIAGGKVQADSVQKIAGLPEDAPQSEIVKGWEAEQEKQVQKIASGKVEADSVQKIAGIPEDALHSEVVKGRKTEQEKQVQKIAGGKVEAESIQKITGLPEDAPDSEVVKGRKAEQEKQAQKISGEIAEEIQKQILKGEKIKPDDFVMRISSSTAEDKKGEWKLHSGPQTAEKMKSHLTDFAIKIGKTLDSLANSDYQTFTQEVLPHALMDVSNVGIITSEEQERLVQEAMKRTARPVVRSTSGDTTQAMLTNRLQRVENENVKMKGLLDAAKTELRVMKDVQKQLQQAQAQVVLEDQDTVVEQVEIIPLDLKLKMMQDLASGKITDLDARKLRESLEREQKILEAAKLTEIEARRAKLELKQKEVFFAQELEKTQRAVKTRDLLVEKSKEGLQRVVVKKDTQIAELTAKIQGLSGLQATSQQAFQDSKRLEQEKQSLSRMVEIYKNKLASASANLEKQAAAPAGKKDDEVRRVSMEKQRADSVIRLLEKDLAKAKSKSLTDGQELNRLRGEKKQLEEQLRGVSAELSVKERAPVVQDQSGKVRELERELQTQTSKLSRSEMSVKELEQKVAELSTNLSRMGNGGADQVLKTKVTHLENTIKKLTNDVTISATQMGESKKEVQKLRTEKTALQNQLDKLKKDSEKAAKKVA